MKSIFSALFIAFIVYVAHVDNHRVHEPYISGNTIVVERYNGPLTIDFGYVNPETIKIEFDPWTASSTIDVAHMRLKIYIDHDEYWMVNLNSSDKTKINIPSGTVNLQLIRIADMIPNCE